MTTVELIQKFDWSPLSYKKLLETFHGGQKDGILLIKGGTYHPMTYWQYLVWSIEWHWVALPQTIYFCHFLHIQDPTKFFQLELLLRISRPSFMTVCNMRSKDPVKRIQKLIEQRTTCSPFFCLARCCSAQCGQTNPAFRPTFLEFRELLRCAPLNQCIYSKEFETWRQMKTSCKRNAQLLSQHFLLPSNNVEQHRAAPSSTEQHRAAPSSTEQHRAQYRKWSNESNISPSANIVRCSVNCWIHLTRALDGYL